MTLALALIAGCGKSKGEDPGPSCEAVAAHVTEVAQKRYPGHGDMMPTSSRKAYVASCQSRKLSAKVRRCMLEAQSMDALAACQRLEHRSEEPAPGTTGAPSSPSAPATPSASAPAAPAPAPAAPASPAPAPVPAPAPSGPASAPAPTSAPAPAPAPGSP
jgi:hypothetical protein